MTFAYPTHPSNAVLNNASLYFSAGQLCFVVGKSGSGKSTLGNLLVKFYAPQSGGIFIDGQGLSTTEVTARLMARAQR